MSRSPAIRYLVWDLDGTLLDTYPAMLKSLQAALHDLGYEVPAAEIVPLMKVSFSHCTGILQARLGFDLAALLARYAEHYEEMPPADQRPFPGVREACALAARLGGNYLLTHRSRTSLVRLLHTHELWDYFMDCVAGDDGYPRKPDPAGLNALLARNQVPRAEALMVGDRELDAAAGEAAGIRTCLYGSVESAVPPDYRIADFAELVALLRG